MRAVESITNVVSANRDVASGWNGGESGSKCSMTEKLRDRRNSNRCDSQTQENTDMSEVGGGKREKVKYLTNKRIMKNNKKVKVTLEQATKFQRGSTGIALLFL